MKPPKRIIELCERLMSPGKIHDKLSASEHHEICNWIFEMEAESEFKNEIDTAPLEASDILEMANAGTPIPPMRALATYANEQNWIQLYGGVVSISGPNNYKPYECEWAFTGPVRPPYELAQNAMRREMPND